ncbi:MAG: hypothetical protein D6730_24560 [Bacteroidetes bacterium]|nr:MAG: hypothetical protein D6730_24560 [Bacteroidota bacterium]
MKKTVFFAIIPLFAMLLTFGLTACSSGSEHGHEHATEAAEEAAEKTGPEYTSAYVCPMHCEGSGSAEPGKCPVCGMEYVKNEAHKADGHQHEQDESHEHGEDDGHGHDHDHDHQH